MPILFESQSINSTTVLYIRRNHFPNGCCGNFLFARACEVQVLCDRGGCSFHQALRCVQGFGRSFSRLGHGRHPGSLEIVNRILWNAGAHGLCRSLVFLAGFLVRGCIERNE